MADEDMNKLVKDLLDIQSERALNYTLLDRGYGEYVGSGPAYDVETYRQVVELVTERFAELSLQARALVETLRQIGRDDLATTLTQLQTLEKLKLQLTVELQLAGQAHADVETDDPSRSTRKKLGQTTMAIGELVDVFRDEITD